ncbi:MAG TPA: tetratricopeptide repeat protein [Candidatus Dormibacteraeota bacterium]|nr:tetratricopeptide repeat protein [Candidatus Dormibacteraeota bacterium]
MPNESYYTFGEFRFDPKGRVLFRSGEMVPLYPKAIEVLACLMENRGQVTTKEDLLAKVWPDTFVEESTLTRSISLLRKALGDTPDGHTFIVTVPKRGYRFVAEVREESADDDSTRATLPVRGTMLPAVDNRTAARQLSSKVIAGIAIAVVLGGAGWLAWMRFRAKPTSVPRIMIAVLPVQNLTGDSDREYIGDGLTESIIAQLGRMNPDRLGVIARTSAMTYKHSSKTISQIGAELHVQYVIESSLRQSGDHFRITTQLIRVKDQTHLWSQDYDRMVHDLMTVQDDFARAIATGIRMELSAASHQSLASVRSANPDAFMAYLEGRYYWNQRSVASLERAIVHLTQATELDPSFALAYSGLADAYCSLGVIGDVAPGEVFPMARSAAERALALDDFLAEAHTSLAYVKFSYDWDWSAAEAEFERGIVLNPNYAIAHHWYGQFLRLMGREQDSMLEGQKALELDPRSLIINVEAGLPYYYSQRYEEALSHFRKALELEPNFALAHHDIGWVLEAEEKYPEAIQEFERAVQLSDVAALWSSLGHAYGMAGRRQDAARVLARLREIAKQHYVSPSYEAAVHLGLGEDDQAMDLFEKAYAERSWAMVWFRIALHTKPLRGTPRFKALLAKMRFP